MTPELVTAIFSGIAAILTPISLVLVEHIRRKLIQVEKQGNNASLELKRVNMVYAKRLLAADPAPENAQLASDAERVYEEAKKANANL